MKPEHNTHVFYFWSIYTFYEFDGYIKNASDVQYVNTKQHTTPYLRKNITQWCDVIKFTINIQLIHVVVIFISPFLQHFSTHSKKLR